MKKLLYIQMPGSRGFYILPLILLCCSFFSAKSQEYSYKHYDIKDGLVGNNVYQSVEDKEGFLWFATETGVSRFDGTVFKNFTTAEGLPDNEILKLFVDSKGRVWMMPYKNEVCYYYKGKIYNSGNDSVLRKLKISDHVEQMWEDGKGNILFFERKGMVVLKADNKILRKYDSKDFFLYSYGGGIDSRSDPYVFLCLDVGTYLYKINLSTDSILFEKKTDSIIFRGNKFSFSYITDQLYIYLNNHVDYSKIKWLVFDNYLRGFRDTVSIPVGFNLISFYNDSLLFFNTSHGALKYNFHTKAYTDSFLTNENISCTLKDHENNLWFSTLGNGIFRLYSDVNKNIYFSKNVSMNSVETVLATDTAIIAGSDDSRLFTISKKSNAVTSYTLLSYDGVRKVVKVQKFKDDIYVLGENHLFRFDTTLSKLSLVEIKGPVSNWTFKDMAITDSRKFFFSTHMMVISYTAEKKVVDSVLEGRSTSICAVDSGLYLGTLKGLVFINEDQKPHYFADELSLLKNRITKLIVSKDKLWIGTNDNGVICFDGKKIVKNISVNNGLTSNLIRALYGDDNYLWVGTDRGLNKISLTDTSYPVLQTYTTSDGIASNMINAVYVLRDTVYLGTAKGLSIFNEKKLNRNSVCDLRILGINVSGKDMQFDSSKLVLKNKDNNIRFDFVAISFKAEGNILYYYKLSGIDSDWKTTRENFLQYPTLPSGNYTMLLYAVNKFGVKSKTATFDFEIGKKLVEEGWFIVPVILLAVSLAWLLANWQIRRTKKRQLEKMANAGKIAHLEQQALKAQMNPHFIFNCLNSIQQYVIDKDILGANKFISGFSKLIRQTLDNSGKESITVAEEESFLRSYLELEKSRFEEKFDYSIHIDDRIQKDTDSLPPMLLQPYIENCIRHGIMHKSNGKGIIDIQFNLSDGKLACTVIDNGIGRLAANNYKGTQDFNYQSRGTDITWQRIKMINKNKDSDIILQIEDLTDLSDQPCGTKVTIVVPLQKPY